MTRFIFRFIAFIFLIFSIVYAVLDAAKIVATSHLSMTGLNEFIASIMQTDTIGLVLMWQEAMPKFLSSPIIAVSMSPAWLVFGILSAIFFIIAYDKRPKFHKIAY